MHVAEYTGLTGHEVALTTTSGEIVLGRVGAECSRYFYFLDALVTRPNQEPVKERLVTIRKSEVEELNYPGPDPT
jgi:hypothetical protein